jgi:hypothetical protein
MRNRLPNALAGPVEKSNTKYKDLAQKVVQCWIEDRLPADGSSPLIVTSDVPPEGPGRFEVSAALLEAVGDLVAGHLQIGPRKEKQARRMFLAVAGGPVPNYAVRTWLTATNRAEEFAHLRDKPLTAEQEREFFDEIFVACEHALMAMANRSYENMDELDEILDSANR